MFSGFIARFFEVGFVWGLLVTFLQLKPSLCQSLSCQKIQSKILMFVTNRDYYFKFFMSMTNLVLDKILLCQFEKLLW